MAGEFMPLVDDAPGKFGMGSHRLSDNEKGGPDSSLAKDPQNCFGVLVVRAVVKRQSGASCPTSVHTGTVGYQELALGVEKKIQHQDRPGPEGRGAEKEPFKRKWIQEKQAAVREDEQEDEEPGSPCTSRCKGLRVNIHGNPFPRVIPASYSHCAVF